MSIPSYNLGYPPDGSSLGQTKATIRDNLDGTFETLGVDHVNNNGVPGMNPPGYHTVIHQVTQNPAPVAITGVNQLYAAIATIPDNINPQLFNKNGAAGANAQMTGNVKSTNGLVWCAGILLQWGSSTTTGSSTTVTFSPAFPNSCFSVIAQLNSGVVVGGSWKVSGISSTQFSFVVNTGIFPSGTNFSWFAIGY